MSLSDRSKTADRARASTTEMARAWVPRVLLLALAFTKSMAVLVYSLSRRGGYV